MKARFLALAALVLGMVSCQQDFDGAAQVGGEVDFQLKVAAPELSTRADLDEDGFNGHDSAYGAIDYLSEKEWAENADLRYSLEVYDAVAEGEAYGDPVKDRMVIIKDKYEPVLFDLRLAPGRKYRFVVFADFVPEGSAEAFEQNTLTASKDDQKELGLRHSINGDLRGIAVKAEAINDELADAYFATMDMELKNSAAQDMILKRPYGKVRVVATDLHELNINVDPAAVKVTYGAYNPSAFNAVTGEISGEYTENAYFVNAYNEISKTNMSNHIYDGYNTDEYKVTNANGVTRNTRMTLFTDYILATNVQEPIQFTMAVYADKNCESLIKETHFNTEIPVQRNHLTTIIGNVLTTATEINVTIDDNFADPNHELNIWDGKAVTEVVEKDGVYEIYEASQLAWFAQEVNGGNKFAGKTVKLCKSIHLNGEAWTPIGAKGKFEGTFDGQDNVIEGLFINVTDKTPVGLFANAKYVRNLKVCHAEIYGHYKAGVIVGDGLCSRIDNCHVENATVTIVPLNKDEANNVGGIVGYLSAENEAYVKNCSVKNATITAYRKVGGIVGVANRPAVVSGNTVENVTIIADMTPEYVKEYDANAGAIIGLKNTTTVVDEDNTIGDNVVVKVLVDSVNEINLSNSDETTFFHLNGGEYSFTEDTTIKGNIQAAGKVTINGNHNKITTGTTGNYSFVARGEDNEILFLNTAVIANGGGVAASNNGKVIFNGESVDISKYTASSPARYNFYASYGGEIVINDGVFKFHSTNNTRRAYVCAENGGKVIINGGTFGKASTRSDYKAGIRVLGDQSEVIIYGGTFGFDPSAWLAPDYYTVKENGNWVVKAPVPANNAEELKEAVADAVEGSTIVLAENVNYGTITAGELKNVTIKGKENSVMTFNTDADSKLENVTLKNVDFVYDGSNVNSGIVINAAAAINNLVIDGCSFVGTGAKAGRGLYGQNPNATISFKNCVFENLGYPIYTMSGGGYESLTIEGCTFRLIKSWAIMPQYNEYLGDLTVTGCTFENCTGGLVKAGKFTTGHTFTFTDNVVTNSAEHPSKNWFTIDTSAATKVVSGNTKDGADWTPGEAEGLK